MSRWVDEGDESCRRLKVRTRRGEDEVERQRRLVVRVRVLEVEGGGERKEEQCYLVNLAGFPGWFLENFE